MTSMKYDDWTILMMRDELAKRGIDVYLRTNHEQREAQQRAAYEAMKANPPALPESFRVRYGEGAGHLETTSWRYEWNDSNATLALKVSVVCGNGTEHDYDGCGHDAQEATHVLLRNIGASEPIWEVVPAGEFPRAELLEQVALLQAKLEAIERGSE